MKQVIFGEVKALAGDNPNGEFEVILSAPTLDRDGEVIDAKAFEPLPDHITFDVDHGMSVSTTVGSGQPFYDGDLLKVRGVYSSRPLAQEVRTLVDEGHIRSTSVAFMRAEREVKDGVPHIVKAELLNGAFVCIPSNREALILASKSHQPEAKQDRKAVAGSLEERSERIRDAVREANPDAWYCWIVATFDDSVVYSVESPDGISQFQASYSIDGDAVTLGVSEPVQVTEVVVPAKSADAEKSTTTDPEEKAAAQAPADPPADVAVAQARADLAVVEALLAL